jgi:hypothetical protein
MIHGTTQSVRFESTPSGATVHAGVFTVVTPADLEMPRKYSYDVEVTKKGYLPGRSQISRATSGAVWGNVLFGGLIGILIDVGNGAAYELAPEVVSITLIPDPAATQASAGGDSGSGLDR